MYSVSLNNLSTTTNEMGKVMHTCQVDIECIWPEETARNEYNFVLSIVNVDSADRGSWTPVTPVEVSAEKNRSRFQIEQTVCTAKSSRKQQWPGYIR